MTAALKVGMISFAHGHANSYFQALMNIPGVVVAGIADEVKSRVEALTERHSIAYYEDYRKLLETDIDAVVICSENVHHAQLTIDSAKAGKHVLCEKPLGISVEEMKEMIRVCKDNGVQLMTAFPCRYITAVTEAKAAIERGEIGEILAIKGTNRGTMPGSWFIEPSLSGGGAVLDHTVHVMDLMNWILDSKVTEVYAEAGTLFHEIGVDDAGLVHVKFENGIVAVIDTSWSRPKSFPTWGDVTMEIIGTKGVISVDSFAQKNEVFNDDSVKAKWSSWADGMDEGLVRGFLDAIREQREVPITGEDGLRSAEVALAAYESIKKGQPVKLA
ncbi:Gfo/Idh/MocA family protein [Paenibacillus sp. J2TS4]|uniref:Gfo/Idh/MocA family protein n=1 Tax=Paenibacillus sp. J2TS4 TaxID=2807194 RepID=UPI001B0F7BC7|nr:Gfo/Idh/MocA family oxidoreductase [Paenibacillus sp. J2TS4]GIP34792.1 dehydrogenase [Paenibacillus sp. J2TS4]